MDWTARSKRGQEVSAKSDAEAPRPSSDDQAPATTEEGRRPRGPDRRRKPTNPFSFHSLFFGRRRAIRRAEDRDVHYYVDRYDPTSVVVFLAALVLSTLDAFITIRLLQAGGTELNPAMRFLLQFGEGPFLFVKFGFTTIALLFLLIHKEYRFSWQKFRSRYFLVFALAIYSMLIVYEIYLLSKI